MKELDVRGKKVTSFDGIIGQSKPMRDIFWRINLAAENDITVLITGESGSGKELVARSIHRRSKRVRGPFIAINTGGMAKGLVQSELFGHERGAFTGATEDQDGLFKIASEGTLFLDEVSNMDHKTQATILRILENREFRRIGGKRTFRTNARIIAATNRDLRKALEEGSFRRDLYFRLEVFTINLPPLRERWEDIQLLVKAFVQMFNREMNKDITRVSRDTFDCLIRYEWPGNVRELKNVIQRAILLSKGTTLMPEHLPDRIAADGPTVKNLDVRLGLPLTEMEKRYIEKTLEWLEGNKARTAKALGISRKALYDKMRRYGL